MVKNSTAISRAPGTCRIEGALYPSNTMSAYARSRSEEHTSELQSQFHLVCRLLLERTAPPLVLHFFPTRRSSDLLHARERRHELAISHHEPHSPAGHVVALRHGEELDSDLACTRHLQDRRRLVSIEHDVCIREIEIGRAHV